MHLRQSACQSNYLLTSCLQLIRPVIAQMFVCLTLMSPLLSTPHCFSLMPDQICASRNCTAKQSVRVAQMHVQV